MAQPFITSRVNGMKIPLHAGQAGIMHRFTQPENRLVIERIDTQGSLAQEPETLIVPATVDPNEVKTSAPRRPRSEARVVNPDGSPTQAQETIL
jgi:hypothetical protein